MGNSFTSFSPSMHRAIEEGDRNEIERLATLMNTVNTVDNSNQTPLHLACTRGFSDVVSFLIEKGAYIHAKDNFGSTPLHLAADYGHHDIVQSLLSLGAFVNCVDTQGLSPLHWACIHGNVEISILLLENGASVHTADRHNWLPVHWACYYGHFDILELLYDYGADFDVSDDEGFVPGERFSRWVDQRQQLRIKDLIVRLDKIEQVEKLSDKTEAPTLHLDMRNLRSSSQSLSVSPHSPFVKIHNSNHALKLKSELEITSQLQEQVTSLKDTLSTVRRNLFPPVSCSSCSSYGSGFTSSGNEVSTPQRRKSLPPEAPSKHTFWSEQQDANWLPFN